MITYRLDCARMTDRQTTHDYLTQVLELPAWYGRNLDALYDLLTGHLGPARVELTGIEALEELGNYGHLLLGTFQAAAMDCPSLELVVSEGA